MRASPRSALIIKINAARRSLKLSEGDYRARITRITGLGSLRTMDVDQLEAVFADLVSIGYVEPAQYRRRQNAPDHVRKIYGLWLEAGNLKAFKDPSKRALQAFVKRQTGVAAPEWLRNGAEARPVIEALKQIIRRARQAAGEPQKPQPRTPRIRRAK